MSQPYPPPTSQYPTQHTAYPYPYPPTSIPYGQAPSTYPNPYQTPGSYGTSGITGYGQWPYTYSYPPPQQHTYASRPPGAGPFTATTSQPPQRSATFSAYTPSYTSSYKRDSVTPAVTGGVAGRGARKQQANFKGVFAKELKNLMYGFGDDRNPANDAVNVMEEILVEYIMDVCQTAGGASRKSRLSVEDLRRALSRPADAKKLARMEELLFMQEDIKRARAQFEESDINQTRVF